MTRQEFMGMLEMELKRNHIADIPDILEEYTQHFSFKLADGYSEEEISAKLGNPKAIAAQYNAAPTDRQHGKKVISMIGLGVSDFFFGILLVLLSVWEIIMAALVLVFAALSIGLFTDASGLFFVLIPSMPYHCAIIFALAALALAALSFVGTVYFFSFIRQLLRAYSRFHKNTVASASGLASLPPLSVYPQFSAKVKRNLRKVSFLSITAFAVCFVVGFIVCAVSAGAIEFWHAWKWFL